jgi:uncharacterized protein (DUF952 family)
MIYHVLKADEWEYARKQKDYTPATFDQDGFIHLCKADQFEAVVSRYFLGQGDLATLCLAPEALNAPLRYENLLGGDELYPHLYGPLNLDAVMNVIYFRTGQDHETGSDSIKNVRARLED